MLSSLHSTEETALASDPPTGWAGEKKHLHEDYYWRGHEDDIKDMLDKYYDLENARPIWTRRPEFGNLLFIFQAKPKSEDATRYYVWNGIQNEVFQITARRIGEIRETINKRGGYLGYLDATSVVPRPDAATVDELSRL